MATEWVGEKDRSGDWGTHLIGIGRGWGDLWNFPVNTGEARRGKEALTKAAE